MIDVVVFILMFIGIMLAAFCVYKMQIELWRKEKELERSREYWYQKGFCDACVQSEELRSKDDEG